LGALAGVGMALTLVPLLGTVTLLCRRLLDRAAELLELSPTLLSGLLGTAIVGICLLRSTGSIVDWWLEWTEDINEEDDEE
jgi:hypothetical protein